MTWLIFSEASPALINEIFHCVAAVLLSTRNFFLPQVIFDFLALVSSPSFYFCVPACATFSLMWELLSLASRPPACVPFSLIF